MSIVLSSRKRETLLFVNTLMGFSWDFIGRVDCAVKKKEGKVAFF
jgi:hypothetical protein